MPIWVVNRLCHSTILRIVLCVVKAGWRRFSSSLDLSSSIWNWPSTIHAGLPLAFCKLDIIPTTLVKFNLLIALFNELVVASIILLEEFSLLVFALTVASANGKWLLEKLNGAANTIPVSKVASIPIKILCFNRNHTNVMLEQIFEYKLTELTRLSSAKEKFEVQIDKKFGFEW